MAILVYGVSARTVKATQINLALKNHRKFQDNPQLLTCNGQSVSIMYGIWQCEEELVHFLINSEEEIKNQRMKDSAAF